MKKYLITLIIVLFSFNLVAYSDDLLSFSKGKVVFEEPGDVIYINITNHSSKEVILYDVDEFPDFISIDPVEGKIFPLGEEKIKIRLKRNIKPEEKEGEIVFIYAKKSNLRNLIYKKIKVAVYLIQPELTPIPTPVPPTYPTPVFTQTPLVIQTPEPIPTSIQTPVPPSEEVTVQTPVSVSMPIMIIKIEKIGIEGERPTIYKKGIGFLKPKDEIVVGEKIKFKAIWDKDTLSSFDALVWETDMNTQIVKVEGEKGEVITVIRDVMGIGEISCEAMDEKGSVIAKGKTSFEIAYGPETLKETQRIQKEINEKLESAKVVYGNRSLDKALSLYNEILSIDPDNKDAKYGLTLVAKAKRTKAKVISLYNKASTYFNKGNIEAAYKTIMAIGNYMWAFSKEDPWRIKVSKLKKTILSSHTLGVSGDKIKKYIAPGTDLYIYTGSDRSFTLFSKKLGVILHREKEIPGFEDKYGLYVYQKGVIVKVLDTGRWEGIYKTNKTHGLDLAFLKVLGANKTIISQMGKGKTPGISLFKGRLRVQIFENGIMIYESKSKIIWYTFFDA